jgi:hypothetical protein
MIRRLIDNERTSAPCLYGAARWSCPIRLRDFGCTLRDAPVAGAK